MMSKLLRIGMMVTSLLAASAVLASCGGGLDTAEATAECDEILEREPSCSGGTARTSCILCYEQCGFECLRLEECPLNFACPGEEPDTPAQ